MYVGADEQGPVPSHLLPKAAKPAGVLDSLPPRSSAPVARQQRSVAEAVETTVEEFPSPGARASRLADLRDMGYTEAPRDGSPLQPGEYRLIDRHASCALRVAVEPPEPAVEAPTAGRRRLPEGAARAAVDELVAKGNSITAIQKAIGMSRKRIATLVGERTPLCGCGRPASHKGSCPVRYEVTPARAAAIERETERARRPEERARRSRAAKSVMAGLDPAERSRRMAGIHAERTPEQKTAIAKKSAARRLEKQGEEREAMAATVRKGKPFSVELDCGALVEMDYAGPLAQISEDDVRFLAEVGVLFARYARRKRRGG